MPPKTTEKPIRRHNTMEVKVAPGKSVQHHRISYPENTVITVPKDIGESALKDGSAVTTEQLYREPPAEPAAPTT